MPVLYTHTRILKPIEDSEPTGLKVDIADFTEQALHYWLVSERALLSISPPAVRSASQIPR